MKYTIWVITTIILFTIGCSKEPDLPVVSTLQPSEIVDTAAVCGGSVTSDGGAEVSARGVCWSTGQNPTIADPKTDDGTGVGFFRSEITGLNAKTVYYVRAYATNSAGTAYGELVTITTLQIPVLTTTTISDITETSATGGGIVTDDGGSPITLRGVCWSKSPNPTFSDYRTKDGSGNGLFSSNITGLKPNEKYYIRSYATNKAGTGYGPELSFTTKPLFYPVTLLGITSTSITCRENMYSNGTVPILSNGFCWSNQQNPTLTDNVICSNSNSNIFTSTLSGLSEFTKYYIRPFVINDTVTFYGPEISFVTRSLNTVTDVDGNIYNTVTIGTQLWMAENLKTKHYTNGEPIKYRSEMTLEDTSGAYYIYDRNDANIPAYGLLYNGFAVLEARNICPAGWHIPASSEWSLLINYLGGSDIAGGKMKDTGTDHWISPNVNASGESGFFGLPGGYINQNGYFEGLGSIGYWWSSTGSDILAYFRLNNDNGGVYNWVDFRYSAYSIRCVKD